MGNISRVEGRRRVRWPRLACACALAAAIGAGTSQALGAPEGSPSPKPAGTAPPVPDTVHTATTSAPPAPTPDPARGVPTRSQGSTARPSGSSGPSGPSGSEGSGQHSTAVDRNADGRLEAVWLAGASVSHAYQLWPNGAWSTASPLGSTPVGAGDPIIALDGAGRLEAFVDSPGGTWNIWQVAPNSSWSDWALSAPGLNKPSVVTALTPWLCPDSVSAERRPGCSRAPAPLLLFGQGPGGGDLLGTPSSAQACPGTGYRWSRPTPRLAPCSRQRRSTARERRPRRAPRTRSLLPTRAPGRCT